MPNTYHFDGRCADVPTFTQHGETRVLKFRLLRNEYSGRDADGNAKERVVSIPFTAFNGIADTLQKTLMKGDQLIVTASVQNNNYKDGEDRDRYDYNFVVDDFTYGAPGAAKREQLAMRE